MVITYHGRQFFKLQLGDTIIAYNPIAKGVEASGKNTKFGADIALISTNLPEYNGVEQVSFGEKNPFVIKGPGEYEVNGVFIKGVLSESTHKGKKITNTIYTLTLDNIKLAFLGALSGKLSADAKELIDEVDILFVPLRNDILSAHDAQGHVVSLEPKLVVPMDYDEKTLPLFLKESGESNVEPIEKLTIKRKDLDGKDGDVVVFSEV